MAIPASPYITRTIEITDGPRPINGQTAIFAKDIQRNRRYGAYFNPNTNTYKVIVQRFGNQNNLLEQGELTGDHARELFEVLNILATEGQRPPVTAKYQWIGG